MFSMAFTIISRCMALMATESIRRPASAWLHASRNGRTNSTHRTGPPPPWNAGNIARSFKMPRSAASMTTGKPFASDDNRRRSFSICFAGSTMGAVYPFLTGLSKCTTQHFALSMVSTGFPCRPPCTSSASCG